MSEIKMQLYRLQIRGGYWISGRGCQGHLNSEMRGIRAHAGNVFFLFLKLGVPQKGGGGGSDSQDPPPWIRPLHYYHYNMRDSITHALPIFLSRLYFTLSVFHFKYASQELQLQLKLTGTTNGCPLADSR